MLGVHSFVVGSDGYLYQGRGWRWVGAHTRGHNTKGYGVGYVGNFSASLPDPEAIALVRDGLIPCAVRAGWLHQNYTLHGHRQMVNTSCPGDALFQEIQTWNGFKVGTGSCDSAGIGHLSHSDALEMEGWGKCGGCWW